MLIEQRHSIGTANHVFTRRTVIAYTGTEDTLGYGYPEDTVLVLYSPGTREDFAEITRGGSVYSRYDGNREDYQGTAGTFEEALKLALGKPAGGAWYGVKGHARTWAPEGWN